MADRKGSKDGHEHDGKKGEKEGHYDATAGQRGKTGFGHFLYDRNSGLVMGRNCKEWGKLIFFYLIFYACLMGFWVAYMIGFLQTTNIQFPNLLGYQSMLKLNPAIGYRPQPDFEVNLIKFNSSNDGTFQGFLRDSNDFLKPYFNETLQSSLLDCSDGTIMADATKACKFNPKAVAPACFPEETEPFDLGFSTGQPCIILKMNRIIGWLPRNTNDTNRYRDVRMRCYGQNEADVETINEIEYYPSGRDDKGPYGLIPSYYFPFMNQATYLSPLVFARFANMKPYTLGLVWCEFDAEDMNFIDNTYWASRALTERAGGAHFELVIDK